MALPDSLDYWSPVAALAALTLGTALALVQPPLPVALALMLGTVVFAAGIFVAVREMIPSYNRLLGVYIGVFGLARIASLGLTLMSASLVVIGSVSLLELAYRRMTGRPVGIM
jgi:hypothetical protein